MVPSSSSTVAVAGKQDLEEDEAPFGLAAGVPLRFPGTTVGAVVTLIDGRLIAGSTVTFVVVSTVEVRVPLINAAASVVVADIVAVLVEEAVAVSPNTKGLTSPTNKSELGLPFAFEGDDQLTAAD
jgi:hypothetical protein